MVIVTTEEISVILEVYPTYQYLPLANASYNTTSLPQQCKRLAFSVHFEEMKKSEPVSNRNQVRISPVKWRFTGQLRTKGLMDGIGLNCLGAVLVVVCHHKHTRC